MKSVGFIIRRDPISIRRFLMISYCLEEKGIRPVFINLYPESDLFERERESLPLMAGRQFKITPLLASRKDKIFSLLKILPDLIRIKFTKKQASSEQYNNMGGNSIAKLLTDMHVDTDLLLKTQLYRQMIYWHCKTERARQLLKTIELNCVVYDLELIAEIRAILFEVRKLGIPILSMQHAEGFGESYKNIPVFADYYIAYSPYNADAIERLGVAKNRIFLTGVPDSDLMLSHDRSRIKNELHELIGEHIDRKVILVALRPFNTDSMEKANACLIQAMIKILGNHLEFQILLKPHITDFVLDIKRRYIEGLYPNLSVLPPDYPISKVLLCSQFVVTHWSACIVEAIAANTRTIVVKIPDGGRWPPWDRYPVFYQVEQNALENVLQEIRENRFNFIPKDEDRAAFLEHFRFRMDGKASERIANCLEDIADNCISRGKERNSANLLKEIKRECDIIRH